MNLREFVCNIPDPLKDLPPELTLETREPKVFGIKWLLDADAITIPFPTEPVAPVTRRTILASIASVYDPLGLVAPATLIPRASFQSQWDKNRSWDAPLPDDEEGEWKLLEDRWIDQRITVPRRTPLDSSTQLHIFCDASQNAASQITPGWARMNLLPVICSMQRPGSLMCCCGWPETHRSRIGRLGTLSELEPSRAKLRSSSTSR
jgi:hypothetical protein